MKLGEYLTAINWSKEQLMDTDDDWVEKKYQPYIVNRCLSYFPDTILQTNNMNRYPDLDKKLQFDYLQNSIRKRKRFSKWAKNEESENFEIVKEYFGYGNRKTREVIDLLSAEDIESIKEELFTGG
tara:strand:- start:1219 stop:1596 length:378 start_codon:yes stop_codon:yes gene_type:complete